MKKLTIATLITSLAVLPAYAQDNTKAEAVAKTVNETAEVVAEKATEVKDAAVEAVKAVETPNVEAKPAETPKVENKPAEVEAPKAEAKPAEAPKAETKPVEKAPIKMAPTTVPEDTSPVQLKSLRGDNDIDSSSNKLTNKKWVNNDKIVARKYIQQPPMIPHSIDNYKITIRSNMCLNCHSWEAAAVTGATKISLTHFKGRDGQDLSSVAANRFFCTQCHVPQVDAEPLIENEFKNASELDAN